MSNRRRVIRRTPTREDRMAFCARMAAELGQTVEQVEAGMAEAVRTGLLTETWYGWHAALPADVTPPDWERPVT